MKPRHIAVVSGLALTLAFGAAHVTTPAFAEGESGSQQGSGAASASDGTSGEQLPAPKDYDKADFFDDGPAIALLSTSSSSLSSVTVTNEMKYFTKYESHSNYRQGFGSGDGYNALGYYQFDRRYSLIPFLTAVYNTNPMKYSMLKAVIDRGSEVKSASSMYDSSTKTLSTLGQLVQDAWYAAYDTDPTEFSAFQDAYAYNSYYLPTENWLKSELGIDMSGRADCVKGMVWGLSNMWGTSGVKKVLRGANLSNSMTDLEFVTALSYQMTDNIAQYSSQTQYYTGWKNRYRSELNDCKAYIALHGASDDEESTPSDEGATEEPSEGGQDASDSEGTVSGDASGDAAGSNDVSGDAAGSNDASDEADGSAGDAEQGSTGQDADQEQAGSNSTTDDGESDADAPSSDGAANNGASNGGLGDSSSNGTAEDEGGASGSAGSSESKPSPAPSAPAGDASTESTGDDGTSDGASGSGSSSNGSNASGESDSNGTISSTDETESDEKTSGDEKKDNASDQDARDTDDGDKGGVASPGTDEDASGQDGQDDASGDDNGSRMPQTSDLVMFAGFAGASAATFGATFIAAGKHRLRKRDEDDAR